MIKKAMNFEKFPIRLQGYDIYGEKSKYLGRFFFASRDDV